MSWNRWAIVEGHYVFCCLWHSGQSSELYLRLCRIGRYFKPGPLWSESKALEDPETAAVYEALLEKHRLTE